MLNRIKSLLIYIILKNHEINQLKFKIDNKNKKRQDNINIIQMDKQQFINVLEEEIKILKNKNIKELND